MGMLGSSINAIIIIIIPGEATLHEQTLEIVLCDSERSEMFEINAKVKRGGAVYIANSV